MFKVWRVENFEGLGCYSQLKCYEDEVDFPLDIHYAGNGHPSPLLDKGIQRRPYYDEICAFISKEQALKWFTQKELKWMQQYDFYLKEIDVDEITLVGEYQVLVKRERQKELNFSFLKGAI